MKNKKYMLVFLLIFLVILARRSIFNKASKINKSITRNNRIHPTRGNQQRTGTRAKQNNICNPIFHKQRNR